LHDRHGARPRSSLYFCVSRVAKLLFSGTPHGPTGTTPAHTCGAPDP